MWEGFCAAPENVSMTNYQPMAQPTNSMRRLKQQLCNLDRDMFIQSLKQMQEADQLTEMVLFSTVLFLGDGVSLIF